MTGYSAPNDKQDMLSTKRKHDDETGERAPVHSNKRTKRKMGSHHQQENSNIEEEETRLQHKVDVIAGTKHALDDTAENWDDDYALGIALSFEDCSTSDDNYASAVTMSLGDYYTTDDDEYALAMAMSFEECATYDVVLAMTKAVDEELGRDEDDSAVGDDDTDSDYGDTGDENGDTILPYLTVANLMDLKEFFEAMKTADNKYIDKLVNLFETCENSEKTSCLCTLRDVIVLLIHCKDKNIMKEMAKDCNFISCLVILEYDTELAEQKADYRQMFSRVGKVKEVLPTDDPHTLQLVNQLIRLQFLMDKILQGTLEEDAASTMNFMINDQYLRFVALKFFRACMDQDDDHFNRLLIRHKVIHSVVGLLHNTKGNKTPTNWACLEFFEYIRKTNIGLLVMQCGTLPKETMEKLSHVPLFKQLLEMHEGKYDGTATVQPPHAKAKSRLLTTPPRNRRPFIKDANKAKGIETGGSPAVTPNGSHDGAGSAKKSFQELFGGNADQEMTDSEGEIPQSTLSQRKRKDTGFEQDKNAEEGASRDKSSGKRKKLDQEQLTDGALEVEGSMSAFKKMKAERNRAKKHEEEEVHQGEGEPVRSRRNLTTTIVNDAKNSIDL